MPDFKFKIKQKTEETLIKSKSDLGKLKMRRMNVNDLSPAGYNPRFITDRAKQGLSNSLDRFGLMQPIIYNEHTGNIVGGHQRFYDLLSKGVDETDVVVVNLSLPQEKAANITLNNALITGDFTKDLQTILSDLDSEIKGDLLLDDLLDSVINEELSDVGYNNSDDDSDSNDINSEEFASATKDLKDKQVLEISIKIKASHWEIIKHDFTSYMNSLDTPFKVH